MCFFVIKADREKKKQDEMARKQEARKMLEEEESAMPAKPAGKAKLTRAEIEANQERQRAEAERGRLQVHDRGRDGGQETRS